MQDGINRELIEETNYKANKLSFAHYLFVICVDSLHIRANSFQNEFTRIYHEFAQI